LKINKRNSSITQNKKQALYFELASFSLFVDLFVTQGEHITHLTKTGKTAYLLTIRDPGRTYYTSYKNRENSVFTDFIASI